MKIWKRLAAGALGLVSVVGLAAWSGKGSAQAKQSAAYAPKSWNGQCGPSVQANRIGAKAKPRAALLKKQLGRPVKVTVSTDYN